MENLQSIKPIKIAYGSVPKDGGTFTFYKNQREALLRLGYQLICVSIGLRQSDLWDAKFADEGCVLLAKNTLSVKKQAKTFVQWCVKENIQFVIGVNSEAILSAIPHLPTNIRVISRAANAFDHGYKIVLSGGERIEQIVALTPRLRDDLVNQYNANPNIIRIIPNGIDKNRFLTIDATPKTEYTPLKLGFLGRLEHTQKGVLHIPVILKYLEDLNIPYTLKIAGKGKHKLQLMNELKSLRGFSNIEFLGGITPREIPGFLNEVDVFLFTSHFEGCPNALLEAMMAGCIPVSWQIDGITDFLITNGETGYLVPMDDSQQFALKLAQIHQDFTSLPLFRKRIQQYAQQHFDSEVCVAKYATMFGEIDQHPRNFEQPRNWNDFKIDENFVSLQNENHFKFWIKKAIKFVKNK